MENTIYKLAAEVAQEMIENGNYNSAKVDIIEKLAYEYGYEVYFDDEYIMVGDEVFYFTTER